MRSSVNTSFLRDFVLEGSLKEQNNDSDKTLLDWKKDSKTHLILPIQDEKTMLKTGELKIKRCNDVAKHRVIANIEDGRDIEAIERFDESVIRLLGASVQELLPCETTYEEEEIRELYSRSVSHGNMLELEFHSESSSTPSPSSFYVYDPQRNLIKKDRLFCRDVVFRAALRPWCIRYNDRTKRFKTLWTMTQAMILDEPTGEDCVLDAEL